MKKELRKVIAHIGKEHLEVMHCPICGHILDFGQQLPCECSILGPTNPFRNVKGQIEFECSGICQDCQDNRYGKED